MDCNECKGTSDRNISYIVFESATARLERTIKRLWVTIMLLILLLFGSNLAWIYYESQFEVVETTTQTIELDSGDGGNAVYNESGEVTINGESKSQ